MCYLSSCSIVGIDVSFDKMMKIRPYSNGFNRVVLDRIPVNSMSSPDIS
jgi:hypothetical protein